MDVMLQQGDHFSLALTKRSGLPDWIRWTNPQINLGQVTLTTRLTGYTPHQGLMLPLGYSTYMDWRNVPYLKIYVDSYDVDQKIADIAAPGSVQGPQPEDPEISVSSERIAPGIWRLQAGAAGSTAFEFSDHITLFELSGYQRSAQAMIDFARKLVPGKPVTQLIISHAHVDHVTGIRLAAANGLTVFGRRNNEGILRELVAHPAPDFPDALARNPKPLKFVPVDEHLRLSDKAMTLDLYWARDNIHMADALFAYAPQSRVMAEGDIATAAYDFQWWPDNYMDNLEFYKLQVDFLSPVHSVWPEHPGVLTHAQVIELIKGGVVRTRAWCADQLAKGTFFTGCPVHSKRY
jgi:glyoxylase-like metal-dependent hydrolase (beta-lactamase superfamily II)